MNKSLVPLKVLVQTLEVAIWLFKQLIRQRCTVRQDFESPLYTPDQLRLCIKLKTTLVLSYATSPAGEIGGTSSRGHFLFRSSEYEKL